MGMNEAAAAVVAEINEKAPQFKTLLVEDGTWRRIKVYTIEEKPEMIAEVAIEPHYGYGYWRNNPNPDVEWFIISGKYAPKSKRIGRACFSYNALRRKHLKDALRDTLPLLRSANPAEQLEEEMKEHERRWGVDRGAPWNEARVYDGVAREMGFGLLSMYRAGLVPAGVLADQGSAYGGETLGVVLEKASQMIDKAIATSCARDLLGWARLAERKLRGIE